MNQDMKLFMKISVKPSMIPRYVFCSQNLLLKSFLFQCETVYDTVQEEKCETKYDTKCETQYEVRLNDCHD